MSDKAIENGEAFVADALLQESQWDEEEEEDPSQPSSAGSTPGGPPPGPDSTDQPKKKERDFSSTAGNWSLGTEASPHLSCQH
ncbi:hypothetical protein MDA_GLEAN10006314 [Myotis davidii]|uniref:Uncharacterized protein n=1 Tax=Myotis davidii TaxID=225400 RepID=L5LPA8_MYODS|nr:hypothetical protein MDA_GLEAN10006314 [Myotis davidii]